MRLGNVAARVALCVVLGLAIGAGGCGGGSGVPTTATTVAVSPSTNSTTTASVSTSTPTSNSTTTAQVTTTTLAETPVPLPVVAGVHMIDAGRGWAVTDTHVLRTEDGGDTWFDRTPTGLAGASLENELSLGYGQFGGRLSNAAFLGADTVWIALPSVDKVTVFSTSDAGLHWGKGILALQRTTGEAGDMAEIVGIDFVNAHDGWIVTSLGAAAGSQPVAVHRTSDGGLSWKTVVMPTPEMPSPGGLPFGGDKTGFGFVDAQHGWLTGSSAANGIWLYATSDAGDTWHGATLPVPSDPTAAEMYKSFPTTMPPLFLDDHEGILPVTGGTGVQADVFVTEFYLTADAGAHWRATSPIVLREAAPRLWSWPDGAHAFAANDNKLCSTADSGQTWNVKDLPSALEGVSELDFVSSSVGWAVVAGRLFKTSDGGGTWVQQR
jgi:photosystem II stability/assembly factor-like uncharacterized protein